MTTIATILCYLSMLFAFICGLVSYKKQDISFRILSWLLGTTFFVECGAYFLAYAYGNNLVLYNVFLIVQFLFIALYFNYSIDTFRRHSVGIWIGIVGVAIGIINSLFFQAMHQVGSYFLLFEGITIISMSLYSFARSLLIRDEDDTEHEILFCPHFWISVSLVFFWSTSFLLWGLYEYFSQYDESELPTVHITIRLVNVITYTSIGIAVLLHHSKRKNVTAR